METPAPVEKHQPRETAVQRLMRESGQFAVALGRLSWLAGILSIFLLFSLLTVDLPMRAFDGFFGGALSRFVRRTGFQGRVRHGDWRSGRDPVRPQIWRRRSIAGDHCGMGDSGASRSSPSFLISPLRWMRAICRRSGSPLCLWRAPWRRNIWRWASYDVIRGGEKWWRAPLFSALAGYGAYGLIYFPGFYWGVSAPWLNWMVSDFTIKVFLVLAFLPVYALLRKSLRPKGGFGGR